MNQISPPTHVPRPTWRAALPLRTLAEAPAASLAPPAPQRITDDDGVRLHAPLRASGKDVLVVLLQGAGITPQAYDRLAQSLQAASQERIWVAVPHFPLDMPMPPEGDCHVRDAVRHVQEQTGLDFDARHVFLAGHSMGGVVAETLAQTFPCAGVMLLGSYLAHGLGGVPTAAAYPRPVLTVGGELDGLTRVTRVAEAWKEAQGVKNAPVVVVPGVNHAAFADGRTLAGDLPAERALDDEHAAITAVMSDFMAAHADDALPAAEQGRAQRRLDQAVRGSAPMLTPFLDARENRDAWVTDVVKASLGLQGVPADRFTVRPSDKGNLAALAFSKPQVTEGAGGVVTLDAPYLAPAPFNPLDISTVPVAGDGVAVKMKRREIIEQALTHSEPSSPSGGASATPPPHTGAPTPMSAINQATLDAALSSVTPAQRQRYLTAGHAPAVLNDRAVSSGPAWLSSGVLDAKHATVQSSVLDTGPNAPFGTNDMHYVKALAPDAAIEWVLVDGLRGA